LWWKFNPTPFVWRNVYAKVSSLLGDGPDLLAEFSKFKPQSKKQVEEASADGKSPPTVYIDHIVELSEDNPCGQDVDSQILLQNTAQQDEKYGVWKNFDNIRSHAVQSTEFLLCMIIVCLCCMPASVHC
jgi:hypothetical protein